MLIKVIIAFRRWWHRKIASTSWFGEYKSMPTIGTYTDEESKD